MRSFDEDSLIIWSSGIWVGMMSEFEIVEVFEIKVNGWAIHLPGRRRRRRGHIRLFEL